jgi:hypothetical protein
VGESAEVEVSYAPQEAGSHQGGVDYFSNDLLSDVGTHLTGTVALRGESAPLFCDVQITPPVLDFGVAEIGTGKDSGLSLFNVGNGNCVLTLVELLANSVDDEFSLTSAPASGSLIEPAQSVRIELRYDPVDRGQDTGSLRLLVNDRDSDEIHVDLKAFGIFPGGEGPVAVCSVDPASAMPFETLRWYGDQSFDTNDRPIDEYQWSIAAFPDGSAATLVGDGPIRTTEADLAGDYTAQLVVVNDLGQVSEPCLATATVIPTEDLWIEMYWTHAGDDMDLHLLAPDGVPRSESDCYYINCDEGQVLDWGVEGYDGDDPHLDLDDIAGTGPENVNIADPADGVYTVFVHDFHISVYEDPNPVTVKVYIDGELVETFVHDMLGEGFEWYVCEIDWASRTVTPL